MNAVSACFIFPLLNKVDLLDWNWNAVLQYWAVGVYTALGHPSHLRKSQLGTDLGVLLDPEYLHIIHVHLGFCFLSFQDLVSYYI